MKYKISIIIPVYNAETYLEECINSIVSSSVFTELEVILVDDGSKDNSGEICDGFSGKYENIKTCHIENGGVSNARNVGLAKASGEYVTFCDADDYYINDIFEKALSSLKLNKPDLLFYDFLYEQEKVSTVSYPFSKNRKLEDIAEIFLFMLRDEAFNSSCNKFFNNSIIKGNNLAFKIGQRHGEDRDFVLHFLSACNTAFYLPESGYFYRYVKTSAVNRSRTDYFDNIYNEILFKYDISKNFDVDSEYAEVLVKERTARQIISCTFAVAENKFSAFYTSMKKLFENELLMEILHTNRDISFHNYAYKKVMDCLLNKKALKCLCLIKFLKLKEQIYKLIH